MSSHVCLYYHALGGFDNSELDVNGFTDMEKEFRLKCTPGPRIAEGQCRCLISVAFREVYVATCPHLMCFVCAEICMLVYVSPASAHSSIYSLHSESIPESEAAVCWTRV